MSDWEFEIERACKKHKKMNLNLPGQISLDKSIGAMMSRHIKIQR
jgi:hypothetical protein